MLTIRYDGETGGHGPKVPAADILQERQGT